MPNGNLLIHTISSVARHTCFIAPPPTKVKVKSKLKEYAGNNMDNGETSLEVKHCFLKFTLSEVSQTENEKCHIILTHVKDDGTRKE